MKKTLTALLLYLILAPIAADLLWGVLGDFAQPFIYFLGFLLWASSLVLTGCILIHFLDDSDIGKEWINSLDERIFGGGE